MHRVEIVIVAMLSATLGLSGPLLAQEDIEGAQDHPLLSRFPGSVIIRQRPAEFDEFLIQLGAATGVDEFSSSQRIEGKVSRLTYEMPKGHSTLEVVKSYEQALKVAGFEIVFSCALDACGQHLHFQNLERPFIISKEHRYLAARADLPNGRTYVTVRVYTTSRQNPPVRAMVGVAEVRALEEDLITVDAAAMARSIRRTGRVAVYGVYFDTDMAVIQAGSEPTLREMATLLRDNQDLNVYIVGHTDNVGTLDYNMDLSLRRAEAVVEALVKDHGVGSGRLVARGVGPLAPVASNEAEEGRARNRRVELVAR
jgi:outer membrane protein OmpA-like peptidoglycan-associated protein